VARSAVAVVVGFTKRERLLPKSFAPLRALRAAGVLDRILYVTWDKPDLDPWVADAAAMNDVELIRIPEPTVEGLPHQKKHFYQTHNIAEALKLVDGDDTLVLKTRPDVVFDANFIASKIRAFDFLCAPKNPGERIRVKMPRSPFAMKVWMPWADSNQPFFFEDGIFAGLKRDLVKLAVPESDRIVRDYGDADSAWIVHIGRYLAPFLKSYPIFNGYLQNYRVFIQENNYRRRQMSAVHQDPFFWHLVLANAWILAENFHVDCGYPGQITFLPPEGAGDAFAGKPIAQIPSRMPYTSIEMWRTGQKPGSLSMSIARIFGRLMDDSWQHALFAAPLADLTPDNLAGTLERIATYRAGSVLAEVEAAYYAALQRIYRARPSEQSAAGRGPR
jgi:hypothetical protein